MREEEEEEGQEPPAAHSRGNHRLVASVAVVGCAVHPPPGIHLSTSSPTERLSRPSTPPTCCVSLHVGAAVLLSRAAADVPIEARTADAIPSTPSSSPSPQPPPPQRRRPSPPRVRLLLPSLRSFPPPSAHSSHTSPYYPPPDDLHSFPSSSSSTPSLLSPTSSTHSRATFPLPPTSVDGFGYDLLSHPSHLHPSLSDSAFFPAEPLSTLSLSTLLGASPSSFSSIDDFTAASHARYDGFSTTQRTSPSSHLRDDFAFHLPSSLPSHPTHPRLLEGVVPLSEVPLQQAVRHSPMQATPAANPSHPAVLTSPAVIPLGHLPILGSTTTTLTSSSSSSPFSSSSASSTSSSTSSPGLSKRRMSGVGASDSERRYKHRLIDANRRKRETALLERFARLSGQTEERIQRDRVTTLEVACDRYEDLVKTVDRMRARLSQVEKRRGEEEREEEGSGEEERKDSEDGRLVRRKVDPFHHLLHRVQQGVAVTSASSLCRSSTLSSSQLILCSISLLTARNLSCNAALCTYSGWQEHEVIGKVSGPVQAILQRHSVLCRPCGHDLNDRPPVKLKNGAVIPLKVAEQRPEVEVGVLRLMRGEVDKAEVRWRSGITDGRVIEMRTTAWVVWGEGRPNSGEGQWGVKVEGWDGGGKAVPGGRSLEGAELVLAMQAWTLVDVADAIASDSIAAM